MSIIKLRNHASCQISIMQPFNLPVKKVKAMFIWLRKSPLMAEIDDVNIKFWAKQSRRAAEEQSLVTLYVVIMCPYMSELKLTFL